MYTLTVSTRTVEKAYTANFVSLELAQEYFAEFTHTEDAHCIALTNGFTGELINLWEDGHYRVLFEQSL